MKDSKKRMYLLGLTVVVLLVVHFMTVHRLGEVAFLLDDAQVFISMQEKDLERLRAEVGSLREMVVRDDILLQQFTHGTWDRECDYKLVPGVLLADGSIRSSLIQQCEEKP